MTVTKTTAPIFNGYITREEYAEQRGISLRTEINDRVMRKSPPFIKIGRKIYYSIEGIHEWLKSLEVCSPKK